VKQLLLALLASAAIVSSASAQTLPPCAMEGMDWRRDPVFLQSLRSPNDLRFIEAVVCKPEAVFEVGAGDERIRILRSKVYRPSSDAPGGFGIQEGVNLINLTRLTAAGEKPLGRFLIGYDIVRDRPDMDPALARAGADAVLTLGPGLRTAYRISGDAITPFDAQAWVAEALRMAAAPGRAGRAIRIDFDRLEGQIAVFRPDADAPATPGSAADLGSVVIAKLAWSGAGLTVTETRLGNRTDVLTPEEREALAEERSTRESAVAKLPQGVEPCEIAGWSNDPDPAGMNVRAEPNASARILGRVPAPWRSGGRQGDPATTYKAEFDIVGYRDGWFLIENIKAPGDGYEERLPAGRVRPYGGRGWVSARLVGAALANGGLPSGQLYAAPHEDAATRPVNGRAGEPISTGDELRRLLACSGTWGLVEMTGNARGWWKGICANQVTNCS
jgi:hypothetical protein